MINNDSHGARTGHRFKDHPELGPKSMLQSRQAVQSGSNTSKNIQQHQSNNFKNNRGSVASRISALSTMKDGEVSGFVGGPNTSPNKKSFTNAFKGASAAKNVKRSSSPDGSSKKSQKE